MYKAVNDLSPDYISDIIPHFVRDTTNYPLHNNNDLAVPFTRTGISRKYCIPPSTLYGTRLTKRLVHPVAYHVSKVNKKKTTAH